MCFYQVKRRKMEEEEEDSDDSCEDESEYKNNRVYDRYCLKNNDGIFYSFGNQ